ncbi:MAG: cyclic nucleotide-binding domain-containing protein [Candidatus Binataceae bacterium]
MGDCGTAGDNSPVRTTRSIRHTSGGDRSRYRRRSSRQSNSPRRYSGGGVFSPALGRGHGVYSYDGTNPVEVDVVRPGDLVGEVGALLNTPRTATVIAARGCRLLRFDTVTLETLFARTPRFGMALHRELARRLGQAFTIKNELQLDHLPEKVFLDAPDMTRMRQYMVAYYTTALKHVLKQHRLLVDRRFPAYETTFTLSPEEHGRWFQLFEGSEPATPFTFHTTVGTMALMRVVGDVGVNFKNLMHLKCEMGMATGHPMEPGRTYRLAGQIEDIIALRDDRVAVVCASRVYDETGFRVRTGRDFFVILNLEPEYVEGLRAAKRYGHIDAAEFQALASREAQLNNAARRISIEVPEDMGLRYGKVSGDLNPVHTTRVAAKILGHPRPFVQGLCTANYILQHLTPVYGPPEGLRVTFAKR